MLLSTRRDVIVIGASAGGVEALQRLCATLPARLDAAVFVVQHLSPAGRSVLPHILNKAGPLPAHSPSDGEVIQGGRIYVAAPDHHMLLRPGHVLMRRGPLENRTRPAVNALFRSAAVAYGSRVVGVVLTGLLDDGTEGLVAIKAAGGVSVCQDPGEAEWPSMPLNAVRRDHVDHVLPLAQIGGLIARLAEEQAGPSNPLSEDYLIEDKIAAKDFAVMEPELETPGVASHLACPDCGGVLNQIRTDDDIRFRCRVGHGFTALGLAAAQNDELERALAIAVRTHRDRVKLFEQMRESAHLRGLPHAEQRWHAACEDTTRLIGVLEKAMASLQRIVPDRDV